MQPGDESGLVITGLQKRYGDVTVLKGVDLHVGPGEVHALLGPNGAGKSTLIKCLSGGTAPSGGEIRLDGVELAGLTPSKAAAGGVAVVHQHLSLIGTLSVADNLFLGQEETLWGLTRRRSQKREARDVLARFGINIDVDTLVGTLPMGVKQLIEIAKAWHRSEVRLLILDEPTASLSETETQRLFEEVRKLRDAGAKIIYTTHRLQEVYEIADSVAVLRDGAVVLSNDVASLRPKDLVSAISTGGAASERRTDRVTAGEVLLECRGLAGRNFGPLDVEARAGEIVGLYGVLGSGRTSILETIAGRFRATEGTLRVGGQTVRDRSAPAARIDAGVILVPADRARLALWAELAATDNMLLPTMSKWARLGLRSRRRERLKFLQLAGQIDLQPPVLDRPGGRFSGGNQQKLIIGRWLAHREGLRVFLFDEPTQGVDVGARRKIYETCHSLAAEGATVLFASTDASEVALLADRALVIDRGVVHAELRGEELTEQHLVSQTHQFSGVLQ